MRNQQNTKRTTHECTCGFLTCGRVRKCCTWIHTLTLCSMLGEFGEMLLWLSQFMPLSFRSGLQRHSCRPLGCSKKRLNLLNPSCATLTSTRTVSKGYTVVHRMYTKQTQKKKYFQVQTFDTKYTPMDIIVRIHTHVPTHITNYSAHTTCMMYCNINNMQVGTDSNDPHRMAYLQCIIRGLKQSYIPLRS